MKIKNENFEFVRPGRKMKNRCMVEFYKWSFYCLFKHESRVDSS